VGTRTTSLVREHRLGSWRAVQALAEGPLDVIGDIHGEIDALVAVLGHLGYRADGAHPEARTMVFVGDLIDRGPDSPGVVRRVAELVERGVAAVLMGNHELNAVAGRLKAENAWLFGHAPVEWERSASPCERDEILAFLRGRPLALERPDLRVVHACWDLEALRTLQETADDPVTALDHHRSRIESLFAADPSCAEAGLAHQNQNPVKLVTSGREVLAPAPYFAGGKVRSQARYPWWNDYRAGPVVVFGHYWRIPIPTLQKDDGLLAGQPLNAVQGRTICIDYSVGGRASERCHGKRGGPYAGRLAALRWPERELVFDNGERQAVLCGPAEVGAW
jgi:hypothetical protein